ncbi:MAG: hypothetical protein ACRYGF_03850 [Janthinobacterium lividum]
MARDFTQNSEQYLLQIDAEIERLQQLRTQVTGAIQGEKKIAAPQKERKGMSVEGRRRVAEAQKARWAKLKAPAVKSKEQKTPNVKAAKKSAGKKIAAA